jgi:predicted PurR-regulated permease PerM
MDVKRIRLRRGRAPAEADTAAAASAAEPPEELQDEVEPGTPNVEHAPLRRPVPPVVVPRWIQLVTLPLLIVGTWLLARAAGWVFLVVIVAALVALMLNPFVRVVERVMPRGLAILVTYLGCFATVGLIGIALANPISNQVSEFADTVPSLIHKANHDLSNLQNFLNRNGIKVKIEHQGQTALQTLQKNVLKSSGSIVSFSRDLAGKILSIAFDLVLCLVLSVYMLVYGKEIGALVRRIMPSGDGTPEDDYPLLVQRAVSGYVRGQLLFSLIMGSSAAFGLWLFGVTGVFPDGSRYTLTFALFYGLMEFIPYVGPIIGPAPAVIVALFENPISAVWVVLLFVGLQQLEGHLVAPQLFRISLRINPILIILALLIGDRLYGIAGSLVALPVAAVLRQTIVYLKQHLVLEPWVVRMPGTSLGLGVMSITPDRCPECGARPDDGDAFCRSCGASLEPRVTAPK